MSVATLQTSGGSLVQADQSRTIQLALLSALAKQVAGLWQRLDPKRLDQTYWSWLEQMMVLTSRFYGMSSLAASIFYNDARQTAVGEPAPSGLVDLTATPSSDWMTNAYGYSAPGLLNDPNAQPGTALSVTQGTAKRIVATGGRTTIIQAVQDDPKALGYYRVTDGHPCAFCAMLAGRGVVYKKSTVDFLSHNDCGCTGAPAFSHGQELPAISTNAADLYRQHAQGLSGDHALAAFRKAWDANNPAA